MTMIDQHLGRPVMWLRASSDAAMEFYPPIVSATEPAIGVREESAFKVSSEDPKPDL